MILKERLIVRCWPCIHVIPTKNHFSSECRPAASATGSTGRKAQYPTLHPEDEDTSTSRTQHISLTSSSTRNFLSVPVLIGKKENTRGGRNNACYRSAAPTVPLDKTTQNGSGQQLLLRQLTTIGSEDTTVRARGRREQVRGE